VELRDELESVPDLQIAWVMADNQVNERSLRFVDGYGLRKRIHFWVDPASRSIDELGIRRPDPEPMEQGVPHPTTLLLDAHGVVRFVDVREDFHIWLAPSVLQDALAQLP
jgi:hypothetical protein